jgi:hypothetical protein
MNEPGQQLALIEPEEDALLLSHEDAAKRYTARTAEKLEIRRDCILALIAAGYPMDFVARTAHCTARIARLLGAKYAQAVAANTQQMVKVLRSAAMRAAFLAGQKMEDAKLGELSVFMGIALQRSQELELAGNAIGELAEGAIDVESESPALQKAREFLAKRRDLENPNQIAAPSKL